MDVFDGKPLLAKWVRENRRKDNPDYAAFEAILAHGKDRHAIFSQEGLAFFDQAALSAAIGRVLPDAKVLLNLRAPDSFLLSQYKFGTLNGRTISAEKFSKSYTKKWLLKLLDVRRYLDAYDVGAAPNTLTVLPYEWQAEGNDGYLHFITDFTGVDFAKYSPPYIEKQSPDLHFVELNRQLNLRLSEEAPAILDSLLYRRFSGIASRAVANVPEFNQYFGHLYDDLELDLDEPRVPEELWPRMREGLAPIRKIEAFEPYLTEYGLATEQKEPN